MDCSVRPASHAFICVVFSTVLSGGRRAAPWLLHNRFMLGIASFAWLILRSGAQPHRMAYPCQRAAAGNVWALAAASAGLLIPHKAWRWLVARRKFVAAAGIAVVGIIGCSALTPLFRGGAPLALVERQHLADETSYTAAELSTALTYPSTKEAIVSVARDGRADYVSEGPHDEKDNPAYALVWRAVSQLGLGSADNPLKGFIEPGDRVLIKPNLEGKSPLQHTRPCVVRPLIDMAAEAGAGEIIVADSAPVNKTQEVLEETGYIRMVADLNKRPMPCKLTACNLDKTPWSWVNPGDASAYTPGEFEDGDLCSAAGNRYHQNPDSHGRTTGGRILNWYALHDLPFDADVVINVPRLKVHGIMVNTLAIKNLVGITAWSTAENKPSGGFARIAHFGSQDGPAHMVKGFGNDIAWRELANINRALLYWKDGKMHDTPQRKVLNVLDAIACGDGSHGAGPKVDVGTILASVDPIAIDAVGSRLMCYDFRYIPMINNAPCVPSHPWGTHDPAKVRLVGDPIDDSIAHLFSNPWDKTDEFKLVGVKDLSPPQSAAPRLAVKEGKLEIGVDCPDASAVFLYYKQGPGAFKPVRMARRGSSFSYTLPNRPTDYYFVAQDEFFNTPGPSKVHKYAPEVTLLQEQHPVLVPSDAN